MQRLPLRTTVMGIAVAGLTAISTPASATHSHYITTPGACVDKGGAGFGTGEAHPTGGPPYPPPSETDPSFHTRVHKGTPGLFAFEQEANPVHVDTTCPG